MGATSAARKHKTEMAAKKRAHLETKRELEVRAKFREKEARANKRKQQLVSQKAAQGKYYNNITSIICCYSFFSFESVFAWVSIIILQCLTMLSFNIFFSFVLFYFFIILFFLNHSESQNPTTELALEKAAQAANEIAEQRAAVERAEAEEKAQAAQKRAEQAEAEARVR